MLVNGNMDQNLRSNSWWWWFHFDPYPTGGRWGTRMQDLISRRGRERRRPWQLGGKGGGILKSPQNRPSARDINQSVCLKCEHCRACVYVCSHLRRSASRERGRSCSSHSGSFRARWKMLCECLTWLAQASHASGEEEGNDGRWIRAWQSLEGIVMDAFVVLVPPARSIKTSRQARPWRVKACLTLLVDISKTGPHPILTPKRPCILEGAQLKSGRDKSQHMIFMI